MRVLPMRLVLLALVAFAGAVGLTATTVQAADAAAIDIRVWQDVEDERSIQVSARHAAGSWATLGTLPLALDDGRSRNGRYRYGDTRLDVSLPDRTAPLTIELRIWQHRTSSARIYVSARPAEGDWARAGTNRLPLDDGHSTSGRYRYGDLRLEVSLPPPLPDVTVEFGDDFTAEQRIRYERESRREFENVARFFANRYQVVSPALTIRLTTDDYPSYGDRRIKLYQFRIEPRIFQDGEEGTAGIRTAEWSFLNALGHEYVHALQVAVYREARVRAGLPAVVNELPDWVEGEAMDWDRMPQWIAEGMAWYLDARHEQARDVPDRDSPFFGADESMESNASFRHWTKERDHLWWTARASSDSLRSMELGAWNQGVGYLAFEQLVARSSEAALFDFLRNLATAPSWQEAFEDTFGLTVDDFYAAFEAWRAEAAPPTSWFSGMVVGPAGEPVQGVLVTAQRPVWRSIQFGPRFSSVGGYSQDDGSFRVYAEPGLAVLIIKTASCDIAFLAEDGGVTRDPEKARRFVIELEGVSDIEVRLPKAPADLCSPGDNAWVGSFAIQWPEDQWGDYFEGYAERFLPWNP